MAKKMNRADFERVLEELGNKADLALIDEINERLSQTPLVQDLEQVLD